MISSNLDVQIYFTHYSEINEYSKKNALYACVCFELEFLSRWPTVEFDTSAAAGVGGKTFLSEILCCFPVVLSRLFAYTKSKKFIIFHKLLGIFKYNLISTMILHNYSNSA